MMTFLNVFLHIYLFYYVFLRLFNLLLCFITFLNVFFAFFQPPIVPRVSFEGDTANFDEYPETNWSEAAPVNPADLHIFSDF